MNNMLDDYDRDRLEKMLDRWDGLSARQWGEDSDSGEINGPRHAAQQLVQAILRGERPLSDLNGVHP